MAEETHVVTLRCLVAWLLGALPITVHLWGHGSDGRTAALLIAVTGFAVAMICCWDASSRAVRAASGVAVVILGELVTVPLVGRAPMIVGATGVACSVVVLSRSMAEGGSGAPTGRRVAVDLPLVVLAGGSALAVVGAVPGAALAFVAAAAGSLLASRGAPGGNAWFVLDPEVAIQRIGTAISARNAPAERSSVGRGLDRIRRRISAVRRWSVSIDGRRTLLLAAAVGVALTPMFWQLADDRGHFVHGTNDINSGLPRIRAMSLVPLEVTAAHPTWFALIRVLSFGVGESVAMTAIAVLSTAAAVLVLASVARRPWNGATPLSSGLALLVPAGWLLLESPSVLVPRTSGVWGRLLPAGEFARGGGFWPLHLWAVPTIVMSMPFVFGMFFLVVRRLGDPWDAGARRAGRLRLALLTVITTSIQPATTLAMIPAVAAYLVLSGGLRRRWSVGNALWFLVPAVVVCLGQVVFLASGVSEYEQAEWLWRPLWHWNRWGFDRVAMWSVFLFVPAAAWVCGRRYITDRAVALSLLAFAFSMPPFLLIEHTTVAAIPDVDLSILPIMSVTLLFVSSLRLVLEVIQERVNDRPKQFASGDVWLVPAILLLVAMAAAGVVDLAAASGLVQEL